MCKRVRLSLTWQPQQTAVRASSLEKWTWMLLSVAAYCHASDLATLRRLSRYCMRVLTPALQERQLWTLPSIEKEHVLPARVKRLSVVSDSPLSYLYPLEYLDLPCVSVDLFTSHVAPTTLRVFRASFVNEQAFQSALRWLPNTLQELDLTCVWPVGVLPATHTIVWPSCLTNLCIFGNVSLSALPQTLLHLELATATVATPVALPKLQHLTLTLTQCAMSTLVHFTNLGALCALYMGDVYPIHLHFLMRECPHLMTLDIGNVTADPVSGDSGDATVELKQVQHLQVRTVTGNTLSLRTIFPCVERLEIDGAECMHPDLFPPFLHHLVIENFYDTSFDCAHLPVCLRILQVWPTCTWPYRHRCSVEIWNLDGLRDLSHLTFCHECLFRLQPGMRFPPMLRELYLPHTRLGFQAHESLDELRWDLRDLPALEVLCVQALAPQTDFTLRAVPITQDTWPRWLAKRHVSPKFTKLECYEVFGPKHQSLVTE